MSDPFPAGVSLAMNPRSDPGGWILFADIDGTLRCGPESAPVLRTRLRSAMERAVLVLGSSRTIEEILDLQLSLGVSCDFLAENGGQIVVRDPAVARALGAVELRQGGSGPIFVKQLGASLEEIAPLVQAAARGAGLASLLHDPPGWGGDVAAGSAQPLRRSTLLLPTAAFRDARVDRLIADLADRGLDVVAGGEWVSVSRGASKGRAATLYRDVLRATTGRWLRTAAIGNADNDESLLRMVDLPFVIQNADGHPPRLAQIDGATLLAEPRCGGWDEALRQLAAFAGGSA